jgi:DNA-binding beta-propeller fold protein YncE
MKKQTLLLLALAIFALTSAAFAQKDKDKNKDKDSKSGASGGFHQVAKWDVGGEGGWDYFVYDTVGKRLFISRGTHVMVVDDSGKVAGDIPDTPGVHGIALAQELGKGFISNGRDNSVTVFDLKTLKMLDKVSVTPGVNPDAIMYEPSTKRVFTFNGRSKDASVIDATNNKLLGKIDIGGKPEFAVEEDGTVFVNDEDKGEIVVIDPKAMTIKSRWPMSTADKKCEGPSGLAIDKKNHRLFSTCDNLMVITDSKSGKVVAQVTTGPGTDAAGFDPGTMNAFASCGGGTGTLTVVHEDSPDKFTVVENAVTMPRARTMTLDPNTHRVFVVTAQFGEAPAATAENPRPRPPMVPNSFTIGVYQK